MNKFRTWINRLPIIISVLMILALLTDFGFQQKVRYEILLEWVDLTLISLYLIVIIIRYAVFRSFDQRLRLTVIDLAVSAILLLHLIELPQLGNFGHPITFYLVFFVVFIRELSTTSMALANRAINPAILFVGSFIFLILMGTLLLLLPNATYTEIGFSDALFTSTSAVCVTGLIVVDTGSFFTLFGQIIILVLIQLGGLGIMTFTSFFSLFFTGTSTFQDQMMLKDITNSEKVGEVVTTLKRIVITTFTVELTAFALIYLSLDGSYFNSSLTERLYFSVFHSISAFCNAGFSTLTESLYEGPFRFAYAFQFIVAITFIIGGLGFPIVNNLLQLIKYRFGRLFRKDPVARRSWILGINTKIILISTLVLLIVGTAAVFLFEYNHSLAEHGLGGKIITAFFAGATPRTAGFNNISMTALQPGTILITIFLMWVGASPGSTGGGIKTTTFSVATLNFISLAKGKNHIEVFKREVSNISVRRAFATISLSIIVLSFAVFSVQTLDPELSLIDTVFECFSAFSTVGLSLGITADLSTGSKMIITLVMFIGRVGALTLLIAFIRKKKSHNYKFPTENILIN